MSAEGWRLVPGRRDRRAARPAASGAAARLKRLVKQVLGPVATRVRGHVGVWRVALPGRVVVVAESVEALRDALDRPGLTRPTTRVTVRVLWWRGPWRGWTGRVDPLEDTVAQAVRRPRGGRGLSTVDIEVADARPARDLVVAATSALRPRYPVPDLAPAEIDHSGQSGVVLVDATRVNPRGRRYDAYQTGAARYELRFGGPGWRPTLSTWRQGRRADLSWAALAALRGAGVVECRSAPGVSPRAEATLLVQLALTGTVVHAAQLAPAVADLLSPALRDDLARPLPAAGLPLELRSVQQRRTALRTHSERFGRPGAALPSVSALLATRRPEHLTTILTAIAGQTYPALEIVLCLHGIDLPEDVKHRLDRCGRPYEVVAVDADVPFGVALGIATARCGGTLVTKFDDDDTYGPEHVWDLVLARHYAAATLVGKGAEFVYLEDADLTIRRHSGVPEWDDTVVAGGTMLIGRGDLEALGGWRPVPRSVDRGLVDRINRAGATIYRTHPLGYLYHRRAGGHTWDPGAEFFLRGTRQRWDGLLRDPEFGTA